MIQEPRAHANTPSDGKFAGIFPALLTPVDSGKIAEEPLRKHVDFLISAGVHGLYPLGTAGEGPLLGHSLRRRAAEIVVEQAGGRVPVMVHVGDITTEGTIALAVHAAEIGADAVGVVTPYYYGLTQAQLERHFREVARAVAPLPVFLYNIPANAKNHIAPATAARLVHEVENIAGLKDSSKDISLLQAYLEAIGPGANILVGSDELLHPAIAAGADGLISALANVAPELMVRLYRAAKNGETAEARRLQAIAIKLRDLLKAGPAIAAYKFAVRWRGNSGFRGVVAPLTECTPEEERRLAEGLEKLAAEALLVPGCSR